MTRLSHNTRTFSTKNFKTVAYGIAVTIAWVLTTVYFILSASH